MSDAPQLLDAIALFLDRELKGQVADARLSFRVLIATHLVSTVANELRRGGADDEAELSRLRQLLQNAALDLSGARRELAARLRDGRAGATPEVLAHLKETLAAKLRVVSPRFELRSDLD